jgi:hypothetical protein
VLKHFAACLFAVPLLAGTVIIDTVYTPDNRRASGILDIQWNAFTSFDGRAIAGGSRRIAISGGAVAVELEPTDASTPRGALYQVLYRLSDGSTRNERWIVPTAVTPVAISVCRYSVTAGPQMNLVYAPIHVDAEIPVGAIDGANRTFTLRNAPEPASGLILARNGLIQQASADYTLGGGSITFVSAATPQTGDTLLTFYRYNPAWRPGQISGPQGDKGDTGATGTAGPQGIKGDKGDTGEAGQTGPQGLQGATGPQGSTGARGADAPTPIGAEFTDQTVVVIPGTIHLLSRADIIPTCRDAVNRSVWPNTWQVNAVTYDVTIDFAVQQSGRCEVR